MLPDELTANLVDSGWRLGELAAKEAYYERQS